MSSSIGQIVEIPLSDIFADEQFNCRGRIIPMEVLDLVRDIERNGLQNPVIVQPFEGQPGKKYRLVAGYRRYTAFVVLSKMKTIPCLIREGMDELGARKLNLQENLIRKDLNIQQESKAILPFKIAGYTIDQVAHEFQQSRGWVQVRYYLLDLDPAIQQDAAAGMLTQEQIRQIWSLKPEHRLDAVKEIKERKLRGEKRPVLKKTKAANINKRIRREKEELEDMIEIIGKMTEMGFHTRVLAWAAGNISTTELMVDLREFCDNNGFTYLTPDLIKEGVLA